MSDGEVRAFLEAGTRTAKVATVRHDGRPHVVPLWFCLDRDALVFTTSSATVKARNLRRDSRVAIAVDDDKPPFAFVAVDGVATWAERPDDLLEWTIRIARRYVGDERADEFGRRNFTIDDWLVRVEIASARGFADMIG